MPGRHPDAMVDMLLDTVYGAEPGEAVQAPGPNSSVASNPPPISVPGLGAAAAKSYDAGGSVYNAKSFTGANYDGVTEDTATFNNVLPGLPKGATVDLGGATWLVDSLNWVDQVSLKNGTLLKKSSGHNRALKLIGSDSATTQALTADAGLSVSQVAVADSSGFSVGDIVRLYDLTYKYAATGQNMEINRVLSIPDGTHVNLVVPTIGAYAAASTATIAKLNAITRLRLSDLTIINPVGSLGGCIEMDRCWGVIVEEGCVLVGFDDPGIWVKRSSGIQIALPKLYDGQNTGLGGRGDGILFDESSHNVQVYGPHCENIRENVFGANVRHGLWEGGTVRGGTQPGVNTHGQGAEHITVRGVSIVGSAGHGMSIGYSGDFASDTDIEFADCDIVYCAANGVSIDGITTPHSHITLTDIRVRGWAQGAGGTFAGIFARGVNDLIVNTPRLRGNANNFASPGIDLTTVTRAQINSPHIRDLPNGYGIRWQTNCDTIDIINPQFYGVSSNKLRAADATSTNIRIFLPRSTDAASNTLQGTEKIFFSDMVATSAPLAQGLTGAPTYGVIVTPNNGVWQTITVTDGVAFTVAAPASQPAATQTGDLTIEISNTSGGAMGVITWNATYVFQALVWANPATAKKRFVTFRWNGTKWVAVAMATADY